MKDKYPDMLDYLTWRGDITFDQVPFGKIDALIFSQLAYLHFDGLLTESFDEKITIAELNDLFKKAEDYSARCDMGVVINPRTPKLLEAAATSERFKNVKICGYKSILDETTIEQFAAMTFILDEKLAVVALRGTDDTIVGWHEDFNIIYKDTIPSFDSGIDYLNELGKHFDSEIVVVGHSKGACVAVYTSINCDESVRNRISAVYNFDGPGFSKDFFGSAVYLEMKDKIHTYFPYFDVVGMVFNHSDNYKIVYSDGFAVFQHDAFAWAILGNDFMYADNFADESKFLYTSFNEWVNTVSVEDREKFVSVFFGVIYASGAKTNSEIEKNKLQASTKMLGAIQKLNSEDKKRVMNVINLFIKTGKNNLPLFNVFKPLDNLQNDLKKSIRVNKVEEIKETEK